MRVEQAGPLRVATVRTLQPSSGRITAILSAFLRQVPHDLGGQSGPSKARAIAWPILSAASTISWSPTWAYLIVIRGSV